MTVADKTTFERKNRNLFTWCSGFYDGSIFRIYFEPFYKRVIGMITKEAGIILLEGVAMLDVACGTGEVVRRLAVTFPKSQFTGVDLTPAMVLRARHKIKNLSNVTIAEGNAAALPFRDKMFDIVLISDALHHIFEEERAIAEIARVLKSGGSFFLVDVAGETALLRFFGWIAKRTESAHRYYVQKEMEQLLQNHGFSIKMYVRYGYNHFFHAQKI
ncbi:MAG: hypothetical protein A3C80_04620 [Candidatus Ryanbacteria bacterium RIFCSPHIGHO2_02_FULL_45_43]|uniref:Methyltransferase type 11 domain-containing protein n=1 Tax=Candidatus Ryanbacteria bacterium RIFCSPHIGHO2_01_45_13 TaxID=1802112 RepID=A0A1G2G033_9BACT|nr:MAG: hypothetical protein A2718_04520 [Candidatus Ryanbacteria bacterium RIFCSPHIGHO2_01_FULL_44_130]OGZ43669.1 MAG: hypothetical protein A2W41_05010 [Candidatus Ryanbacteria bacterium RIFCSPHIGHO2_01_45_13]OGZ49152.1 MAG: hypothetical protein A3C80_04620 [Candidatus Ryanbacteria bacterium RIFCSPHIGHO2_02_FULL_45_43]OGZ50934.1 MAG: hypothetical protein A3E55_00695 [Candidatus Ryanbacteria bacterium RIFCSPHIGHO2_12_FULL_44_20]OGZ51413.1 MAG: hypothetical protein A3A17_00320 [Candidatus Ryanba